MRLDACSSGKVRSLPIVHRQRGRCRAGFDGPSGRDRGQANAQALPMRHGEVGRGHARSIEQADGIAAGEVDGAHRLIIQGDGFLVAPVTALSLRVLDHGTLR